MEHKCDGYVSPMQRAKQRVPVNARAVGRISILEPRASSVLYTASGIQIIHQHGSCISESHLCVKSKRNEKEGSEDLHGSEMKVEKKFDEQKRKSTKREKI